MDKTLTLTMEDALISPEGLAILAGADLIAADSSKPMYVHTTSTVEVKSKGDIVLDDTNLVWNWGRTTGHETDANYQAEADVFCMILDDNGEVAAAPCVPTSIAWTSDKVTITCHCDGSDLAEHGEEGVPVGSIVLVDYYSRAVAGQQIDITPDQFAGNFYIEADTLFRRESDGVDLPAQFIVPNGKIQSNFSLSLANSGDPSTFTFTVDAFPAFTKFDKTKKVLASIQIVDEAASSVDERRAACDVKKN